MASTRITVNTSPLTRLGSQFRRRVDEFPLELEKSQEKVGKGIARAFARAARARGYKKVAQGVTTSSRGNRMVVEVHAVDPESGYDYALVTRLGHRVQRIEAKRAKMLRFKAYGKVLFRHSVRAWSPVSDWAEDAVPEVEGVVTKEADLLAKRLARKLT